MPLLHFNAEELDCGDGVTLRPFSLHIGLVDVIDTPARFGDFPRRELRVTAHVIDRDTGEPTTVTLSRSVDMEHRPREFWQWTVRDVLVELLLHELDETLLFEGKQMRDPHKDDA